MMRARYWLLILLLLSLGSALSCDGDDDDNDDASPAGDDDDDNDNDDASPAPEDLLVVAGDLIDTWITSYAPETMGWSWDSGVLMSGVWDLYELTGEAADRDYVKAWIDHHLAAGVTIAYNDHVPPGRLALRLWQDTGEAKYRAAVDAVKSYILDKAERLPDGALVHMGWVTPQQIWVDTVFMVTPFLVEVGTADGDEACFTDAARQFETFAAHLRDADTGLYRHRYDDTDGSVMPPVADYWARGNAWVIAASGISLDLLPATQPARADIDARFAAQVEAMTARLGAGNRFSTIMNRADTYLETSAGALFAFGVYRAAAAGAADEAMLTAADRALRGALDEVAHDDDGNTLLLGTSYGTGPSTWEMYQEVLKGEQVNYGVGAVLLAIAERTRLERTAALPAAQATDDSYIPQPETNEPTDWGYFYLARGDFYSGWTEFDAAVAADPGDREAQLGLTLIEGARFVMGVLADIDALTLGDTGVLEFLETLLTEGRTVGESLAARTAAIAADPSFAHVVERFVMTEQGGSTAVGTMELDLGEAYLLQGVAHLLRGLADFGDALGLGDTLALLTAEDPETAWRQRLAGLPAKDMADVADGLDAWIAAIDALTAAVEAIDAETDDQSDDLIPRNVIYLEGEIGIPGVLLPTSVAELLQSLGIDPDELFGGDPMPGALLDFLGQIRFVLTLVRGLLPA